MTPEFNRGKVLKEIKSLEAMGMTEKQVAEKLNNQNFKTKSGLGWSGSRLASFKHWNRKGEKKHAKAAKLSPRVAKTFAKPAKKRGGGTDLATLALKHPGWSDSKRVRVLSAILAP